MLTPVLGGGRLLVWRTLNLDPNPPPPPCKKRKTKQKSPQTLTPPPPPPRFRFLRLEPLPQAPAEQPSLESSMLGSSWVVYPAGAAWTRVQGLGLGFRVLGFRFHDLHACANIVSRTTCTCVSVYFVCFPTPPPPTTKKQSEKTRKNLSSTRPCGVALRVALRSDQLMLRDVLGARRSRQALGFFRRAQPRELESSCSLGFRV